MKLLIVDDEKHVINAIKLLIPMKTLGITEVFTAQSCAGAKVLLDREKPDIAIVDIIIQQQTGMSLLAYIRSKELKTKVIAVSGHSDYEYVRTMLLGGAVDYLLKPVEASALIQSIKKAQSILEQEDHLPASRQESSPSPTSLSNQYIRSLLLKLLQNSNDISTAEEIKSLMELTEDLSDCRLIYYSLDLMPVSSAAFAQHLNIFETKVKEYCSVHRGLFFWSGLFSPRERLILITQRDRYQSLLEKEVGKVYKATGIEFCIGMSECTVFPSAFPMAFSKAREAFLQSDSQSSPDVIQSYGQNKSYPVRSLKEGEKRKLLSLLILQDWEKAEKAVVDWVSFSSRERLTLGNIQSILEDYAQTYQYFIDRVSAKYPSMLPDASERLFFNNFLDEYYLISRSMIPAAITQCLKNFGLRFAKNCDEGESFLRIALYMELNYDSCFDQTEYARMFHLHKDYLSRRFKQVFGEGMINYMNRTRIAIASEMIRDPSLRIRDIAYSSGFEDEKYFSRQFKAFTGCTPSEFRAMLETKETPESGG